MGFLMTEPNSISCTQLAETYNISHDSVNRFLEREDYTPHDLYQEAIQHIDNNKLIVSIDDTVLDKPYSQHMDLVSYFWSGKHHRSVKGINLITLYATDQNGQNIPINFRIYDKSESKTKNDYFMDMLSEVLSWGAKILNHIFSALMAYVEIQKNQFERIFENVYRWQKKLFRPIIKDFIDDFILDKNHLLPQRIYK